MTDKISFIRGVIRATENESRPQAGAKCLVSARELEKDSNMRDCPKFSSLFTIDEGGDVHPGLIEICAGESVVEQALYICLMTMGPGQICRVEIPTLGSNCHGNETTGSIRFTLELFSVCK